MHMTCLAGGTSGEAATSAAVSQGSVMSIRASVARARHGGHGAAALVGSAEPWQTGQSSGGALGGGMGTTCVWRSE